MFCETLVLKAVPRVRFPYPSKSGKFCKLSITLLANHNPYWQIKGFEKYCNKKKNPFNIVKPSISLVDPVALFGLHMLVLPGNSASGATNRHDVVSSSC